MIISLVVLLCGSSLYGQVIVTPKICLDLAGSQDVSLENHSGEAEVATGVTLGVELLKQVSANVYLGGGIQYQLQRELEDYGGNFGFLPIYAIGLINFLEDAKVNPGLIFNIGYNVAFYSDYAYSGECDLAGGLYLAIGGRVSINDSFFIEGLFKKFGGNANYEGVEFDLDYSTFSLGIGLLL